MLIKCIAVYILQFFFVETIEYSFVLIKDFVLARLTKIFFLYKKQTSLLKKCSLMFQHV